MREHCVRCHGPEKQKGKLRLDTLGLNFADPAVSARWADVANSLNAHEMPPEEEKQPQAVAAAHFASWIEAELTRSEIARRSARMVMRRINRAEYNNTIRDLVGVDFQPADRFPEDPPAGGFDNIGQALSLSPMQLELYYAAAQQILDRALVEGPKPEVQKWHFDPEENTLGGDRLRVKRDGNNILLNPGTQNPLEGGNTVLRGPNKAGFRDFKVKTAGEYIIRFRAFARIPTRAEVVASARLQLEQRRDEQNAKNRDRAKYAQEQMDRDLRHFETFRSYDYGAPRARIELTLGGQPSGLRELEVDAPESAPREYEVRLYLDTQNGGVSIGNTYEIPRSLENFWMQGRPEFARPALLLDWIELEGPINPTWPPASHQRLLGAGEVKPQDEERAATDILTRFMTRAFRRPVQAEEVRDKLALFKKVRPEKDSFVQAMKTPLAAVLSSPNFLFLVEPAAPTDQPRPLNAFEIASRLSYFLWSSMPDDELLRLAASGELLKLPVLGAQTNRMLADPKSEAFIKNFAGQWLGLRKMGANPPVKNLYPEFDRHFEVSATQETEAFFSEILRHDLDARNLIKSDFVTVNERLARFYGIPGVKGDEFRRVKVPPELHRGGLVTQASIQCLTSNGTRTSPVTRGVWVLKTLLGTDPGLPVANVGEIAATVPGIDKATVRQRLEIHRQLPACARCHDKIDPLGFALENFDACGEWRVQEGRSQFASLEKGRPMIDPASKMPDGTEFSGVEGLQAQLLKKEDLFLTALASQLTTYAIGRELGFSDRPSLRKFVELMKYNKYTLRSLILAIATSDRFTTK